MSRATNRIEIPVGVPDDLITLGNAIKEKHTTLGADSPINVLDMTKFTDVLATATAYRTRAKKLHDEAESLNQQANGLLGILKSQNSKTEGTLYSLLTSIRDVLVGCYKGKEEKLSEWGFKVVPGSFGRKAKKVE